MPQDTLSEMSEIIARMFYNFNSFDNNCQAPNGLRYWQVSGRGQCLRAGKTRNLKNAPKWRRIPPVQCTLC
jgi:hypothetical protein